MAGRGRGEVLEDVDYDVTDSGAAQSDEATFPDSAQAPIPLSKRKPSAQFRAMKANILADLEYSAKWRKQATEDMGFVSGDQLSDEDKQLLDEQGRPHIVFNRVETILKAIAGMEINGRHEIQFLPRNNADTAKNELLTAASKWMGDGCDAEDEQSEAFQETLAAGLGWVETRYSFENEAEGAYVEEQIDCREMVWDRTARKKNLRDARRVARLRRMPLIDAMEMFPGKSKLQIDAVWANNSYLDEATLKSIEERRIRNGEDSEDEYDDRNEVTVVVLQWREKETYYRVVDTSTNTIQEYSEAEHAKVQRRLGQIGDRVGMTPQLHSRKASRWAYFQAFIGAESLLDKVTPAPCGKQFSWACLTGSFDKKRRQWYGLIRVMRDPQLWANKFMSQIMQIMNATAKGGILAETDAFDDQREAEDGYALPDVITWVSPGALSGQKPKILPKPGTGDASAYVNLLTYAVSAITAVTGINLELLGQQDQNQPGIVEHMRKQAGMTVLATMFDSLRGFLKIVGRKRLFFIQTRVPDGTLIRVAGQEYQGVAQLSKDKTVGTFDVIVDDAPTSPNQKEANWAVMQPMLAVFKDQLAANPELLIMALEYSPLPTAFVAGMKKVLQQQDADPQKQQYQETMKQLAISKLTAEIDKDQSIAEMNNAKAGATSATATYDLAMAQNLLAKNDIEGFQHHIQAMSLAAKAEVDKANAVKARVQATREAQGISHDQNQHASDMADAHVERAVGVHNAVTDRMKAHIAGVKAQHDAMLGAAGVQNDRMKTQHDAMLGAAGMINDRTKIQHDAQLGAGQLQNDVTQGKQAAAINHISALAGVQKSLASANRDRVGAMVDARPEPAPAP